VRWGPRRIDLDLLAWEGNPAPPRLRRAAAPSLGGRAPTLPHPRAFTRPFVLIPWADAAPAFRPAEAGSRASPAAGDSIAERAAACTPEGVQAAPSQETRVWERVTGALCRPR
jgi:7,8-dihydro-6-hydroxymethylpterin-pyrophosphokinase